MPARQELREGQCLEIGGVPFCLAYARGKRATLFIAGDDGSGLLETADDVRRAAERYLSRLDRAQREAHDY